MDVVEFDSNVLHIGVANMVFSQATRHVVITMDQHREWSSEMQPSKELTQEGDFMGGVMECDVFSIAGRVRHHTLLLGHPRNRSRPQVEAIATDGVARLCAVSIVGVRVSDEVDQVFAAQGKAKCAGPF